MSRSKLSVLAISMFCALCWLFSCQKNPVDNNPTPPAGSTSHGYFIVFNPVSGGSYSMGAYDSITWTSSLSPSSYVRVYLYNDQQLAYTYSTYTLNDGVIYWYLPTNLASGNRYHIKIQSAIDTSQFDFGGYFTLNSPYFGTYSIQNPVDSTVWPAGNSYAIQWQYTGSPGTYVTLRLYNDSTFNSSISTLTSLSAGSYTWTIPGTIASGSNYRIKITSYSDSSLYRFSERFTISGVDPDAFENDNARDSAKTAVSGVIQQHTLTYSDTDWVRVTTDSGKTYIIQDSGATSFRTYVLLYYGTETSYTSSHGTNTSGILYLPWTCTRSGTYYLKIYPYYTGYTGSYTLRVTELNPQTSATFSSPISSTTWAAGSTYTINWTPDVALFGTYVNLYLYKGNQLVYTFTTYISNSGSYSASFPAGLATGSDYRIRIANYSYTQIYGYSQNFTISGVASDAFEFDNLRDSASTAPLGTAQQHTITLGDTDWVRFSADSGSSYALQVNTGSYTTYPTRVYFYLYYGTATSYTYYTYSSTTGSLFYLWPCMQSGTWYVRMHPYSSTYLGNYSFRATKLDSSTAATFTNPTSGSTWSAGSSYPINWTPDSGLFGTYVNLYLYKGNQPVYTFTTYASNSGSSTASLPAGLATGSDYRIRIANYSYTQIYGYSEYFTVSGMTPDAFEFDNIRDSASPLTLGTIQQHNLTYNDTDWVTFSADSGSRYVVMSTGTSGYRIYAYLFLGTATSYTAYFYSPSSGSSILYNSPWTCAQTGTYYLRIYPYSSGTTGSYALRVVKFDSLTAATFSSPDSGATWATSSTYTISWIADTALFSNTLYLYLYKGSQNITSIASNTANDGTQSWTIPAGLATGSDYRIRIVNYASSSIYAYSKPFTISGVTPDAFEYDDTAGAAKSITTDGTVQNRTLWRSDIDWISFTAEKDSMYLIQGSGSTTAYMYQYLYSNPTGSYLTYQYGYSPKIMWTCPASGTYYVHMAPYSTSYYGNYQLFIRKYSSSSIITFINPAAASVWTTGSPYSIQWVVDTALFSATVRLQLTVDTTTILSIAASATNSGTWPWTPAAGLATGSRYRIRISNYTYPSISGYSPAFSISGLDPDAYEPDDSSAIAHTIATSGTAENHTMTIADRDWYKFNATADSLYVIRSNSSIRPALYLYSTDATLLLSSANTLFTDTSATIVWLCPTSGTYYFRTTSSLYGSYQTVVNAYDSAAYRLTVTAPATGNTLTTGVSASIQWSNTVPVGGNVDIFLYDINGIVGTIIANTANSGNYSWTTGTLTSGTAPAGSTYYIRVISRSIANIFGDSGVFSIQ